MITARKFLLFLGIFLIFSVAVIAADNSGRIYGKITTVDGDVFEGLIRWDKNEAAWVEKI